MMKDHNYEREDGTFVPVAKITDQEIYDLQRDGFEISNSDGEAGNIYDVPLRLEVELIRRRLGIPLVERN